MNKEIDTISIVEKETIANMNFPEAEVLAGQEEINTRQYEAERAMKLGNFFKDKVKIIFEDNESLKMVETTIWGVIDKRLLLKRGLVLPIYRVHEIII